MNALNIRDQQGEKSVPKRLCRPIHACLRFPNFSKFGHSYTFICLNDLSEELFTWVQLTGHLQHSNSF